MGSKYFEEVYDATPPEIKIFVQKNMDIAERVHEILERQGKTQKDLAKQLGKRESEISKWLSGLHNLTLNSIAKLEAALEEPIINVPLGMKSYAAEDAPAEEESED